VAGIYRELLLNFNEPFIRHQAESLARYEAFYCADRRVRGGLDLPPGRTFSLREHLVEADRAVDALLGRLPPMLVPRRLACGEVAARAASFAFRALGRSPWLEAALRERGTTLIHAHTGLSGAQMLPLARRLALPLLVTYHGYEAMASDASLAKSPRRGAVFLRRRERMKREVRRFVAVSEFMRALMRSQGYPEARTVRLYTGVDVASHAPAPGATRERVVFFAARLVAWKGADVLLAAMQAVQRARPGTALVMAGTGDEFEPLQDRARELGVDARFVGAIASAEVGRWMQRASVLALPSVQGRSGQVENLPGVGVEALASGLPIVGSRSGGIPELVDDGVSGVLVPPGNVEALARALLLLLDDDALRARLGAAGRERALRDFDLAQQTAKLEALYDEAREEHAREVRGRR
jgi:glycosyltransferase involved in cell wall biosynthesis